MAKQVMPTAELEPRSSDVHLPDELLVKLSLFAQLKRKPSLDKFPGALVVRKYRRGEVICRQGEAGWTAFYILTSEDAQEVLKHQLLSGPDDRRRRYIQDELQVVAQRVQQLKADGEREYLRQAATVHLSVARPSRKQERGLLERIAGKWMNEAESSADEAPLSITIDGPTVIDYGTLQATLHEGELFGEMSCMANTPRSATIVASRDGYMLEMLRNIFEQIRKDDSFKAQSEKKYKERIFQLHLRRLSIFADLNDAEFNQIRDGVDLVSFEPGQVIFDENERSDCMYIVRSGLVKIVKKMTALLSMESVRSWPALCQALREAEKVPAGTRGKVWGRLASRAQALIRQTGPMKESDQVEVLTAINEVIKDPKLPEAKEFQAFMASTAFRTRIADLPENRKQWSEHDLRTHNRILVEELFPNILRKFRRRVGPDCVLNYCAPGEFIGEMGVMLGLPRSATCMAYGHPSGEGKIDAGPVELVRIPAEVILRIVKSNSRVRHKLEKKIAERQKQTQQRIHTPVWDDSGAVQFSEKFEELGLIQGQRLMIIDLDRCTRCDECVQACVNTHSDGNSRLFLDGPRFGKYLVPTTCRSCLDPVCMIGCPVTSIHRGNNGQMVIEDWCIGCGLCSKNCPYGSIQMHDIGIVGEDARGWLVMPASAVKGERWMHPRFSDSGWYVGAAPFVWDREFQDDLLYHLGRDPKQAAATRGEPLYFRYSFNLGSDVLKPKAQFKLEASSQDQGLKVYVNGEELVPEKAKGGKFEFSLPPKPPEPAKKKGAEAPAAPPPPPGRQPLRAGRNVIAVKVVPGTTMGETLFTLRLDEIRRAETPSDVPTAEEVLEKLVTQRAVVCDLCSSSLGKVPACVNACPHDAAMRVDARFEFPAG